jgi:hypothetical protein
MNRIRLFHRDTLSCEPILRRTPGGELLCVAQCGDVREPAPGNRVYVFHSRDEGETWTSPVSIYPEDGQAVYATEVMVLDNVIHAFLTLHNGSFLNWKCVDMISRDDGYNWENAGAPPHLPSFAFVRGMIRRSDGGIVIPYQYYPISPRENDRLIAEDKKVWDGNIDHVESGVLISGDGGSNYERFSGVKIAIKGDTGQNWAWTEPTIAELSDGRLVMLLRVCGTGYLWRSESANGGKTWSEAVRTDIPNPSNKPKLISLDDGRIALIHTPNPKVGFENRNPLSVWVSDDDLQTFRAKLDVTDFPGCYCYPDGIYENGSVLFTIEYNRHDILFVEQEV